MAKGKPMLNESTPTDEMRAFAEEPVREMVRVQVSDEVKRQVPLRLAPSVIQRITILAGKRTVATGVRVTNQELLEEAVMTFLKRQESALRRQEKGEGSAG